MTDYEQLSNIPLATVRAENRAVNQHIEDLEEKASRVEDLEEKASRTEELESKVEQLKADINTRDEMLQQFAGEKRKQALARFEQANQTLPEAQQYDLAELGIDAEMAAEGGENAPEIAELERVATMVEQQAENFAAQRQQVSNQGNQPDLTTVGAGQSDDASGASGGPAPGQQAGQGGQGGQGQPNDLAARAQEVAEQVQIGGAWQKLQAGEKLAERAEFNLGNSGGNDSGIDETALASALTEAQSQSQATQPNGGTAQYPPQGGNNGGGF